MYFFLPIIHAEKEAYLDQYRTCIVCRYKHNLYRIQILSAGLTNLYQTYIFFRYIIIHNRMYQTYFDQYRTCIFCIRHIYTCTRHIYDLYDYQTYTFISTGHTWRGNTYKCRSDSYIPIPILDILRSGISALNRRRAHFLTIYQISSCES